MTRRDEKAEKQNRQALALAGIGLELAAAIALLTWLGWWLDGRWGTTPWLMVAGLALGFLGGFTHLYQAARRYFD